MKIEVLYIEDCPHYLPAMDRLRTVLSQEGLQAEVLEIEIKDESAAKAWKFLGSPTIRINGHCRNGRRMPAVPRWGAVRGNDSGGAERSTGTNDGADHRQRSCRVELLPADFA